jgi:hypothetical protein
MPILVNSVESNLVNNEVLTMIAFGTTWEGGFGSTGRLQEVGIHPVDYEPCNDLYDGEIVDCPVSVCLVAFKRSFKATPAIPFSIGKARGRKEWIDATIRDLSSSHPASCGDRLTGRPETTDGSRLTGTLETIDAPC